MNIELFIAKNYLANTKKIKLIQIITKISIFGMILGNSALIVSSSVYNGLTDMVNSILKSTDADIKIIIPPNNFNKLDQIKKTTQTICGADNDIYTIIEGYGVAKKNILSTSVKIRGIDNFEKYLKKISNFIPYKVKNSSASINNFTIIGEGVAASINAIRPYEIIELLSLTNTKKRNVLGLNKLFKSTNIILGGIFSIDTQKDQLYIFVPIAIAKEIFENSYNETFIEIELAEKTNKKFVIANLKESLKGYDCMIESFDERQSLMISAIKMEKNLSKVTFIAILLISILNIFFCINAIFITKKDDIGVLLFLGLPANRTKNIFLYLGSLIAVRAIIISSLLSTFLLLIQKKFELLKMGAAIGSTDAYPVKIQLYDFVVFGVGLFLVTMLVSFLTLHEKKLSKGSF